MSDERPSDYYAKWYAANRANLSKKRKERYRLDESVRERAVEYQREYRANKTRPSTKGQAHYREVAGTRQQVYRIAAAAEMAGCSIEFIRKYEAAGVIPPSTAASVQRYYTVEQIKLIKDFYDLMTQLKYSKDAALKQATMDHAKNTLHSQWLGAKT